MTNRRCRPTARRSRHAARSAALAAALALAVPAFSAHAQQNGQQNGQPPQSLSEEIRTTDNATAARGEITAFIDGQIAQMQQGAAQAVAARPRLLAAVEGTISDGFRDEYTRLLGESVARALDSDDAFVRLNAAIAVEGVAARTRGAALVPAVVKMLEDESPGVSLYGIKAARSMLEGSILQDGGRDPLLPAMRAAVERHRRVGPVADETYVTLLSNFRAGNGANPAFVSRGVPILVPATLDLIEYRTGLFGPGVPDEQNPLPEPLPPSVPPQPLAEADGILLITFPTVWPRVSAEQKLRSVATLRNLMLAARDAAVATAESVDAAADAGEAEEREKRANLRIDLTTLARRAAQGLQAIASGDAVPQANPAGMSGLATAAAELANLPRQVPIQQLVERVDATAAALEEAFPTLPAAPGNAIEAGGGEANEGNNDDAEDAEDDDAGE